MMTMGKSGDSSNVTLDELARAQQIVPIVTAVSRGSGSARRSPRSGREAAQRYTEPGRARVAAPTLQHHAAHSGNFQREAPGRERVGCLAQAESGGVRRDQPQQ